MTDVHQFCLAYWVIYEVCVYFCFASVAQRAKAGWVAANVLFECICVCAHAAACWLYVTGVIYI